MEPEREGEAGLADAIAFALAPRPDRLTDVALAQMPAEQRAAIAAVTETLAKLPLAEPHASPGEGLRARLLASVAGRAQKKTRAALLVIDMIRDHLDSGVALEVPRAREIVPALEKRIADARAQGTPIIYVLDEHEPNDSDLSDWGVHALKGSTGADVWPPLAPMPGDRVIKKATYSAFFGTTLAAELDELAVDTLVLTGCLTEVGLMTTATDALQRGFSVEIPPDSQAGLSAATEQATLAILGMLPPYGPARDARLGR